MDTVFGVSYDGGGELVWWLTVVVGQRQLVSYFDDDLWFVEVQCKGIENIEYCCPNNNRTLGRIISLSLGWYFKDYYRCLSLLMFVGHSMSDIFCWGRAAGLNESSCEQNQTPYLVIYLYIWVHICCQLTKLTQPISCFPLPNQKKCTY